MIVCLILAGLIIIGTIIAIAFTFKEEGFVDGLVFNFIWLFNGSLIAFLLISPFIALDKASGSTVGKITSVDKNFFGTTAIYLKVNETKEEKYCAENEEIIELAKEYIGKYVKISYGTRVGLYHLNQCRQAPIEKIELEEEK